MGYVKPVSVSEMLQVKEFNDVNFSLAMCGFEHSLDLTERINFVGRGHDGHNATCYTFSVMALLRP